ncbi:MAG: dihydroorotase [Peptococcaceae bacterium]|nr:dihydroorotase [Peptococcaceae bacterium]
MKLLIKNGTIINPVAGSTSINDILLTEGKIVKIGAGIQVNDAEIFDATGMFVTPGLIDMHVHLREPGFEYKEDIASGTGAAAVGGFTAVACMPNTNPIADNASTITYIVKTAKNNGLVRVYPIGAITKGSKGNELAEMGLMREAGAIAFSDDGSPVMDAGLMRRAMQYAGMLDMVIISHCEDKNLSGFGLMHEGYMSTILGLPGIPASAEDVMVTRDILLAEETGCRLHIAHVSTAGAVMAIRAAKARGVRVTAEATPHHFTLTDTAVAGYHTATKVNPPLREATDVEAVKAGLADNTIDVIASDHAPHADEEKEVEYALAPFGMVGLETTVGLVWTELVATGVLTPIQAVAKMTNNPAKILGIPIGVPEPGAIGDLTIIDPSLVWTVDPEQFVSKSRNTPFAGGKLTGKAVITIVNGRIVK